MIFVESVMDPHDAPTAVIVSSNKGAELDYGPRGPQYREHAQLRPTAPNVDPHSHQSATLEDPSVVGVLADKGTGAGAASTQVEQTLQ
jgi:hypothetical protein